MQDGTEGQTIAPGGGEVGDPDVPVAGSDLLTPLQQGLAGIQGGSSSLGGHKDGGMGVLPALHPWGTKQWQLRVCQGPQGTLPEALKSAGKWGGGSF